jgi:hypothetical protein
VSLCWFFSFCWDKIISSFIIKLRFLIDRVLIIDL